MTFWKIKPHLACKVKKTLVEYRIFRKRHIKFQNKIQVLVLMCPLYQDAQMYKNVSLDGNEKGIKKKSITKIIEPR